MTICTYTVKNRVGCVYRYRVECASWADEPYPPGGALRVMRDVEGRAIASAYLPELLTWEERHES